MNKRIIAPVLCLCLLASLLGGCGDGTTGAGEQTNAVTAAPAVAAVSPAPEKDWFSDGDLRDASQETPDAEIVLSGASGTISDNTRGSSGSTVTVASKGVYRVSGSSRGVQIRVRDDARSGNVYLVLDGVSMENREPCIWVEKADKVILLCLGDCSLTSTGPDSAAVYGEDDLTLGGSGTLSLSSQKQGLVCRNDLKLVGGTLRVQAAGVGLKAGDSVRIRDARIFIRSGRDGIQVDSDSGEGYFYMASGSLGIESGNDGISVGSGKAESYTGFLYLAGGAVSVIAGGGSEADKDGGSRKGLKCGGNIYLYGADLTVSSPDDAVRSGGSVSVAGGSAALSSGDDGVCAAEVLEISGGELTVSKSYEGLEAETVSIRGGVISVCAGDDGINAAGDGDTGTLSISGGTVYVNANGDGLDSNGSIYVSGGLLIVEGPVNRGNGALDKGDGAGCTASVTGGTVLAIGTADMAVNFDSGTQCSALVSVSGTPGTVITVDDGTGFSFTATKPFACAVYSSPGLTRGAEYTLTAGRQTVKLDFRSGLYYRDLPGGMGGKP